MCANPSASTKPDAGLPEMVNETLFSDMVDDPLLIKMVNEAFMHMDAQGDAKITEIKFAQLIIRKPEVAQKLFPSAGAAVLDTRSGKLFKEIDADHNHAISREELATYYVKTLGLSVMKIADMVFDACDTNKVNTLNLLGLSNFIVKEPDIARLMGLRPRQTASQTLQKHRKCDPEAIFAKIDRNKKNQLGRTEFQKFVIQHCKLHMEDVALIVSEEFLAKVHYLVSQSTKLV